MPSELEQCIVAVWAGLVSLEVSPFGSNSSPRWQVMSPWAAHRVFGSGLLSPGWAVGVVWYLRRSQVPGLSPD